MMTATLLLLAAALPPHAARTTPPTGIEGRALPVGSVAEPFTLPDANGGRWTLHGPAALVFYRGHW